MDLEEEIHRWPVVLSIKDNEILSSWLIRNSIANGSDPISFTGAIWNNWRGWSLDIDKSVSLSQILHLSKISGVDYKKLYNSTLKSFIPDSRHGYTPWIIPLGSRNRVKNNGFLYCNECIKDNDFYIRKSWRLAWSTACSKHKILLSNTCPICHFPFAPHLIRYYNPDIAKCQYCNGSLIGSKVYKINDDTLKLQEHLNNTEAPYLLETNSHDEQLEALRIIITLIQRAFNRPKAFNKLLKYFSISQSVVLTPTHFERKSIKERHVIFCALTKLAYSSLDDLILILRNSNITRTMFIQQITNSPSIKYISQLLDHSSKSRVSTSRSKSLLLPTPKHIVNQMMNEILRIL
ncbi:TniQ family protein [Francisella philomiragia]|uniref:TniQ family protein n=1 Tax=Francisella philomiragia TaxID=28110 RepID=UPI001908BABD|nr:TniQ family protein [Francisella philomiragia]MBK2025587.1 TniQ family protein [Francisella philomiragia]